MAHQPAPYPPVGSAADIEQRIRRFYSYWDDAVGDIPSKDALPDDRIDIELEILPEDEAHHYEARQAYVASGFIVRGFYPNVRGEHRTVDVNGRFGVRSQTIPTAVARCARTEDPIGFPKAEQVRRDNTWAVVFDKQPHPVWQQIDSRGRVLNEIDLGFLFCFPRILGIQASVRNVKKEQANELAMDEWLNNATFTQPSVADGSIDHWYQLPGRPVLPGCVDERKKGSPSTPLFSPFRLTISRQGQPDETVIVIFRIAPDRHGTLRPWKKAVNVARQPTPVAVPRPRLPPIVAHNRQAPFTSDPQAYKGRIEPPSDYSRRLGGAHSLSHRKQRIYNQVSALGENRFM